MTQAIKIKQWGYRGSIVQIVDIDENGKIFNYSMTPKIMSNQQIVELESMGTIILDNELRA